MKNKLLIMRRHFWTKLRKSTFFHTWYFFSLLGFSIRGSEWGVVFFFCPTVDPCTTRLYIPLGLHTVFRQHFMGLFIGFQKPPQFLIVIALGEVHSSALLLLFLSLFLFFVFLCVKSRLVGVGESDERDQSAPAQTAPQQAGFGSYWVKVLLVVVLGGDIWGFRRSSEWALYFHFCLCCWYCDAPDSSAAY